MDWNRMVQTLHREESGQDLIEYALIAAFLSVAAIASMQSLATSISAEITKVTNDMP